MPQKTASYASVDFVAKRRDSTKPSLSTHAVPRDRMHGPALCGKSDQFASGYGWKRTPGAIDCPKCVRKLAALRAKEGVT